MVIIDIEKENELIYNLLEKYLSESKYFVNEVLFDKEIILVNSICTARMMMCKTAYIPFNILGYKIRVL